MSSGFKCFFKCLTPSTVESANFNIVSFGAMPKSGVGSIDNLILTITGGYYASVEEFNLLNNEAKHIYLKSYFNNPVYVKGLTIDATSKKTNGVATGADSGVIQEVSGSEGVEMELVFVKPGETQYGWAVACAKVSASGMDPATIEYTDIWLITSGYGKDNIRSLSGCVAFFQGDSEYNVSSSLQADLTKYNRISPNTKVIFDNYEKLAYAIDANGIRVIDSVNGTTALSASAIKSINYMFINWSNHVNTVGLKFFVNSANSAQCGILIDKSGSYWRLSSPTLAWFDTVTFNGASDVPEVLWTQTACLEIQVTDTYVKVIWNGDVALSYNLKKSTVELNRASLDTQIGATSRYFKQSDQGSAINNSIGLLGVFSYHPGTTSNTVPSSFYVDDIRAYLRRLSLKG